VVHRCSHSFDSFRLANYFASMTVQKQLVEDIMF
jgi:hypothetical protein